MTIILSIENDDVRIVDNNLDNYLRPIKDYPNIDTTQYPYDLFKNHPCFFDRLHDGDAINSQDYADIYMAYLLQVLNIDVANILWNNYQKTLQGELGLIWYWQKQWLKHVFSVKLAKQLRQFSKNDWITTINNHLLSIKIN